MSNCIQVTTESKWIVINTHPHKEALAIENLQRQSFEAYCPMMRKRIRHARRSQDVLRPLFPGYVFTRIDTTRTRSRSIASTLGVRTLISFGERLAFLQEDFVSTLKAREVEGAIIRPVRPYEVGQQVHVSGGAFDGLVGTILEMNQRDRLIVLMDLLNRSVKVKLKIDQVAAA